MMGRFGSAGPGEARVETRGSPGQDPGRSDNSFPIKKSEEAKPLFNNRFQILPEIPRPMRPGRDPGCSDNSFPIKNRQMPIMVMPGWMKVC
jgi:hypothetical protein